MPALRFGPAVKQLFGFHHAPTVAQRRATSILLCNPFATDALRAQRMFRMLGERLARSGFHVLRFDYYATGDSDGDCEAADIDQWTEDILIAHRKLEVESRVTHCAWIGLGLGAALAARASLKVERPLAALVLWEPVLDGRDYLAQLGRMHDKHFKRTLDGSCQPARRADDATPPVVVDQLLGYPISARLQQQFFDLSQPLTQSPRATRVIVLAEPHDHRTPKQVARWLPGTTPQMQPIPAWSATEFDDVIASAVVYNDVIRAVAAAIDSLP